METRSISELREYLESFKREMPEIDIRQINEVPKFFIPNWPTGVETQRIRFRIHKKVVIVVMGKESKLPTLKERIMPRIGFFIDQRGNICTEISRWSEWSSDYSSNSDDRDKRLACFVLFSQCLDEICKKTIGFLSKKLAKTKIEKENYERLVEAVRRSFEPLIPFVVADILSDDKH